MGQIIYYSGGLEPAAPAQNMAEEWNDATEIYTSWDINGNVTGTRPYNAVELAAVAAQTAAQGLATNQATLRQKAQNALATNQSFLALTSTFPLTAVEQQALVAQVAALTRQINALIYLQLQEFSSTGGT
jgi:hypothetical protein